MVPIIGKPKIPKKCKHCEEEIRSIIQVIWKADSSIDLWKGTHYIQEEMNYGIFYQIYQVIKLISCDGNLLFQVLNGQLITMMVICHD